MKLCIVGAGAIGGYLGAGLSLAGEEVTLIARGPHLAAMRKDGLRLLRPFDHARSFLQHLAERQIVYLQVASIHPEEVHVVDRDAALVLVHEHERRAVRVAGHARSPSDALRQRRLACAERPAQQVEVAGLRERAEPAPERLRLLGAVRFEPSIRHRKCSHPSTSIETGSPRPATNDILPTGPSVISPITALPGTSDTAARTRSDGPVNSSS